MAPMYCPTSQHVSKYSNYHGKVDGKGLFQNFDFQVGDASTMLTAIIAFDIQGYKNY